MRSEDFIFNQKASVEPKITSSSTQKSIETTEGDDSRMMEFLDEASIDSEIKDLVGRPRMTAKSLTEAFQSKKSVAPENQETQSDVAHNLADAFFVIGAEKRELINNKEIKKAGDKWFVVTPKVLANLSFSKYGESIQKYIPLLPARSLDKRGSLIGNDSIDPSWTWFATQFSRMTAL